ncbi:MAG: hypothetical protein LBJ65_16625 [Burkholderia sp.]|jgi:rubrerythrin|uniref:hypothetical protein n=1 Tax=Burkholderia sp. TaxID=36773 RepID=UPI00281DF5B2|nr:hypothetical protein [Burkholderia sp.]MDR0243223.1 hypothetical protein [Burkholderia sp.]
MPIMTITASIAGLKNAIDLTRAAVAARDELKLAEMQQSINDRVIDVQNAALALQEKQAAARDEIDQLKGSLREAKQEIATLRSEHEDRSRYKLVSLSRNGVAYEYVGSPDEAKYFICQPCYDGPDKRKVALRFAERYQSFAATWVCPVCNSVVRGD